jgi:hypothetical protein
MGHLRARSRACAKERSRRTDTCCAEVDRMTKAIAVQCKATPKQTGKQCKRKSHPRWRSLSLPRRKRPPGQSESRHPCRGDELGPRRFDCRSWRSVAAAVTQSAAGAQRYASELEQLVDDEGLAAAMVGEIEIPTKHGGYKAGEYIRGLAQLEAQERDRCANFATKAVAAGLAERTVRVAERQESVDGGDGSGGTARS